MIPTGNKWCELGTCSHLVFTCCVWDFSYHSSKSGTALVLLMLLLQWPKAHGNLQAEGSNSSTVYSSTSCSVEAFLDYLAFMLPDRVVIFLLALRKCWAGWPLWAAFLYLPSWCGEAVSQLLHEPEEQGTIWICSLGNVVEQAEQHKGQQTAKLLAFSTVHSSSLVLALLL